MYNILTIDVEDWFHILNLPSTPPSEEWDHLPSRIEKNFRELLDIADQFSMHATCFCLAWVARRFPHLLRETDARGHEIASHGCWHRLVYEQSYEDFLLDISDARKILEDTIGKSVTGYRAPGFSVTEDIPWFFDAVAEAGYRFDSSVFPARRGHGGMESGNPYPHDIHTSFGTLHEYPISTAAVFGKRFCFSGGGYFRLFPYGIISHEIQKINNQGQPVIVYIHPREIDPGQPRLPMNFVRQFKSYIFLAGTAEKLKQLFQDFQFISCREYMSLVESGHQSKTGCVPHVK